MNDAGPAPNAVDRQARIAASMARLKRELVRLIPLFGPKREIALLDIPDHQNVGDRMIHAGEERLIREHRVRVVYRCTVDSYDEGALRSALSRDTVLALHGGGNFGTIWPRYQRFREAVLQAFPERDIIVLPQSIEFEDEAACEASAALFRAHKRVTICVRDRESEAVARARFSDRVLLVPDCAHALWGHLRPHTAPQRSAPLLLARRDKESTIGRARAPGTDWLSFLDKRDERIRRVLKHQEWRAERWGRRLPSVPFLPKPWHFVALDGAWLIRKGVRLFSQHDEILTDRLHAVLLACLLGRRVRYLDNSYGKLSRYLDLWLPEVERITAEELAVALPASPPADHGV